jgi:nucleoside-diphosphate-sugar epimerase
MKLFVTGAAGNLGTAVVRKAVARGDQVVALDVKPTAGPVEGVVGSVTDPGLVRELAQGCDAIIHTAALHGAHRETHSFADFIAVNVQGMQNLLQAAVDGGVKTVVFSSTAEVVIGRSWDSGGALRYDERAPTNPDWKYPVTKLMAEQLGWYYAHYHGLRVAALRYMSFGGDDRRVGVGLVARHLPTDDVAEANLRAVELETLCFEVFNIGPDCPLTNEDVVRGLRDPEGVLEKYWPGSVRWLRDAGYPIPPILWPVADITKAKQVLGWRPTWGFADLIAELRAAAGQGEEVMA